MATHYRLDGFSGLVGVVEWDDGYVMVQDVIGLKKPRPSIYRIYSGVL